MREFLPPWRPRMCPSDALTNRLQEGCNRQENRDDESHVLECVPLVLAPVELLLVIHSKYTRHVASHAGVFPPGESP